MSLEEINAIWKSLRERVAAVVVGQERTLHMLMAALLAEGHVLVEGVPGTAKTLLARVFSACLDLEFKRIQFTPDLMPGDIVGTNLFDFTTNSFTLTKGPVFTEFLLADEINRTPPKTQSALLESMQERSVTIDGMRHALPSTFTVVATQNSIEQEGTYPLPEAQLDRFLFKLLVSYPEREQECAMVKVHGHRSASPDLSGFNLTPVVGTGFLTQARSVVAALHLSDPMVEYIVDLVRATRSHPAIHCGASPRAANMLAIASRSVAVLDGRDFTIPDDVKSVFLSVMGHRIVMAPGAEVEGRSSEQVLRQILEQTAAPR